MADDPVSGTDADRHDDIYRNGSSGFGGNADSAETADLSDVIGEGANVDLTPQRTSSGASHSTKTASSTPTITARITYLRLMPVTARMNCLRLMRCDARRWGRWGDSLEVLSRNERKLASSVISNPTDHFDNGRGRHNLGFVLKTPRDFGKLC